MANPNGNPENLKILTPEEARKHGRAGGIASGKERRRRKTMAEFMRIAANAKVKNPNIIKQMEGMGFEADEIIGLAVSATSVEKKAEQGDLKAVELRHRIWGDLVERSETTIKAPKPLIDLTGINRNVNEKEDVNGQDGNNQRTKKDSGDPIRADLL